MLFIARYHIKTKIARVQGKKFSQIPLKLDFIICFTKQSQISPGHEAGRAPCCPLSSRASAPAACSPGATVTTPSQPSSSLPEVRAWLIERSLKTIINTLTLHSAFLKAYLFTRGILKVFYVWSKHKLTHLQFSSLNHDAREGGISINLMSTLFQRDRVQSRYSETQTLCYNIYFPINIVESYIVILWASPKSCGSPMWF